MDITRENIDELNAVLKLKVEKNDYEKNVENILKDYRKKAVIKGFRTGSAPMGMIKKMYGKTVLLEEVNKLISENLSKYLVDEKLNILGEPLPSESVKSNIDLDTQEDFEFAFDIAFAPEFELSLSKRDKLIKYDIKVDDEMIQQTTDNHTARFGKSDEADVVEEKDLVKGVFEQLDADGNVLENGVSTDNGLFAVDTIKDDAIQALLMGAKKEDIIDFEIEKAFTNVTDLASMLNIDKELAESLSGNFRFTVKSISRHMPAKVDQELFDKVYGEGVVKTEEEFKAKIIEDIKQSFESSSNYKLLIDAKEKLVGKVKLTLPDAFLKRWLVAANKELTQDSIDKDYDIMRKDLQWQLIKNKIIDKQEMKLEEDEILDFAKKSVLMQFQQYGLANLPDEQLETYAKQMLQNEDERRKMINQKYEEKIIDYLKETIKIEDKEVSSTEFNELFKN